VVMGADGSRVECPMTRSNERGLGCAGKDKTTPQLFVTTLFHVVAGLPWGWIRGRGDSSERGQLRRMLKDLPRRTLLLMDAGFPGYVLLRALLLSKHDFIVRVGGNVRLLRGLGWEYEQRGSTVYLWPQNHRKRSPLVLRLVEIQSKRRRVYLLTSVRGRELLKDGEVALLYRLRWGIEVMYRTLKRTLDHHKMRSDTPQRAKIELDWYVVGLWVLGLMALEATSPRRRLAERWSAAGALSCVRMAMRNARRPRRRGGLRQELSRAVQDSYVRSCPKKARHYPRKNTERPAGRPKLRMATRSEVQAAQAVGPLRCPN
jgi:Transposase DDE domain